MEYREPICPCSKMAVARYKGIPICAQCLAIEQRSAKSKHRSGVRHRPGRGGVTLIEWDKYHGDFTPIAGGSLIWLDEMLSKHRKAA